MIKLKFITDRNVSIILKEEDAIVVYKIPVNRPQGLYTSWSGYSYFITSVTRFKKSPLGSNLHSRMYNIPTAMYSISVPYINNIHKFQEALNTAYFKLKRAGMIDARIAKLEKLEDKKSKNPVTVARLEKELELLKRFIEGEPFGYYMITEKFQTEINREKETKQLPF